MKLSMVTIFKVGFFIGLILLFVSLFLDWYSYKILDGNQSIIASWNYNLFLEWYTSVSDSVETNDPFKPSKLSFPWPINFILIIIVLLSGYISITDNFEDNSITERTHYHSEIYIVLIALNFFYYWCFPIFFLFPKDMLFPYLKYEEFATGYVYFYSIGPGYIFNFLAFIFIFPYASFFIHSTSKYKKETNASTRLSDNKARELQIPINLDRMIIKEKESIQNTGNNRETLIINKNGTMRKK